MTQIAADRYEAAAAPAVANPAPLGLCAFALTTFVLSSINAGWFPNVVPNIVVGLAFFYGGLGQVLAGMWEFRTGNTFGGTAFTSYGGFWMAFGAILLPGFGIASAFSSTKGANLDVAIGLFLLGWAIFTGLMFLGTLRTNIALMTVFGALFLTFLALAIGFLGAGSGMIVLGGYLGVVTALAAWYAAAAGVYSATNPGFTLPVGPRS